MSQCLHRIDPGCLSGRKQAGHQHHCRQQACRNREGGPSNNVGGEPQAGAEFSGAREASDEEREFHAQMSNGNRGGATEHNEPARSEAPREDPQREPVREQRTDQAPLGLPQGLWGLGFGNDAVAGPSSTLFFATDFAVGANLHGLFGSINPTVPGNAESSTELAR